VTDQDHRPAALPVDACCAVAAEGSGRAVRAVLWLSVASLLWMTAEGARGLWAGVIANSVSLGAFKGPRRLFGAGRGTVRLRGASGWVAVSSARPWPCESPRLKTLTCTFWVVAGARTH